LSDALVAGSSIGLRGPALAALRHVSLEMLLRCPFRSAPRQWPPSGSGGSRRCI